MPKVIPPRPGPDDEFFWQGAREGRLLAHACASCGRIQHPPSPMCPACGSVSWEAEQLSGRGTVLSWIVSHHPTEPDEAHRVVALIELDEGIRLVSNLCEVGLDAVANDMPVEVTFIDQDGVILPQFRPLEVPT